MPHRPSIGVWAALAILLGGCAMPPSPITPIYTDTATPAPTNAPTLTPTATPVTYPMRLEQVGQFGGASYAMALHVNYVYMNVGPRLLVVDVSNPRQPVALGRSEVLPGDILQIGVKGDNALVFVKDGTVYEFNISVDGDLALFHTYSAKDTDRPKPQVSSDKEVTSGDYTFTFNPAWPEDYIGAQPLTVRGPDPAGGGYNNEVLHAIQPLPEGEATLAIRLAIRGRYVYGVTDDGLQIYDLGLDPERLPIWNNDPDQGLKTMWHAIGTLTTDVGTVGYSAGLSSSVPDICVFGDYLYTKSGRWDLSDPTNPQAIHEPGSGPRGCYWTLVGNKLVASGAWRTKGILPVYDISDPGHPVRRDGRLPGTDGRPVGINKNTLYYIAPHDPPKDGTFQRLEIYDVSSPDQPRLLSTIPDLPPFDGFWSRFQDYGKFIVLRYFVSGESPNKVILIDVTDPSQPRVVDKPPTDFPFAAPSVTHEETIFAVVDNRLEAYHMQDLSTRLSTIDIPIPGYVEPDDTDGFQDRIWFAGEKLFVSVHWIRRLHAASDMLAVFDVADPVHPVMLAHEALLPHQVIAYGDTFYFQMIDRGIEIYKLVPN